ncbi:uncharacterized protein LOC125556540 [Triticum urartu]|uniref:Bifunctional inhibitor/plant lipid transfer protein/seed storage helical domain-containing protein n=1 Tax=Triticum urartu TaxID=4572 RepID=A0A8R7UM06_TRIUA|nr:uncharacterized protein LOC123107631 [Triticum aestivum]XP_048575210.1 uncharacterized protein LOC125556540 [Triticum urartu]
MERSHLHHHLLLLLLVVGVGLLATEVAGHEQESCDTAILAHHINILSPPTTEKDPGGASCEVVRSGVDSSLAAAAGVTPCLCLLDDVPAFLVTGFFIAHVPAEIYAPCGGQHVNEAQLLAEKCGRVLAGLSSWREEEKDKDGAMEDNEDGAVDDEAIRSNTDGLAGSMSIVE